MNILGVTLARGGSKSIPHKNIAQVNGRPLIQYTVEAAKQSRLLTSYIINTDCDIISECCSAFVENIQFGRPENLSSDTASSGETLAYVVDRFEAETRSTVDYVVELMATNPLKIAADIDACVSMLIESDAESVIALGRLYDHHPSRIKYLDDSGYIQDFFPEVVESRRQDLTPHAYIRAGSIYAMKRELLYESRRYGGDKSRGYILPDERFMNIDEPKDLVVAEALLKNRC